MAGQMRIQHIVLWSFADDADLQKTMVFLNSLPDTASRNGEKYILESRCGKTVLHEPIRSQGFNLASILVFRNEDDRVYFVTEDPLHNQLKAMVTGQLNKDILVLDFILGQ